MMKPYFKVFLVNLLFFLTLANVSPLAPQREQTIYLRVEGEATLVLPLSLWLQEALAFRSQNELLSLGLLYGVLLTLIGYYAFLGLTTPDRSYIYYAILLFSFMLNHAALEGLASQYLWPAWSNRYGIQISGVITLAAMLVFTAEFLSTRYRDQRLHKVILGLLALLGLSLLLLPFVDFLLPWLTVITLLVLLVVGVAGWRVWRQ